MNFQLKELPNPLSQPRVDVYIQGMPERDPNLVKYEKRAFIALFVVCAAFFALTTFIGGDALNGKIENGIYYVSKQGTLTAVTPLVWNLSAFLGAVWLGGVVLAIAYKIISGLVRYRPSRPD